MRAARDGRHAVGGGGGVACPTSMNAASPTAASVFDAMTAARSGIERGMAQAAGAARAVARGGEPMEFAAAAVTSLMAVRQVEASAQVLTRADRALGTLLDVRA